MIHFLLINGERKPFCIDLGSKEFTENFKPGFSVPLNAMELVAYCGFRLGHRKQKRKIDFIFEDMEDWLDDNPQTWKIIVKLSNASGREAKRKFGNLNRFN